MLAAKGTRVDNALVDEIEKANISHAFIVTEEGKQIKVLKQRQSANRSNDPPQRILQLSSTTSPT